MRSGKLKYLPLCSLGPSLNIGMMARTASSKTSRLFSMVMSNGSSSVIEALSPMPNSAAAARQQVEAGDALGDVGGMVGRELQDAVAQPDLLGALAGGRQERGGRGRVGVFLEEVVLDLPGVVVAQLVGQLELARAHSGRAGARRPPSRGAAAATHRRCRTSCAVPSRCLSLSMRVNGRDASSRPPSRFTVQDESGWLSVRRVWRGPQG